MTIPVISSFIPQQLPQLPAQLSAVIWFHITAWS